MVLFVIVYFVREFRERKAAVSQFESLRILNPTLATKIEALRSRITAESPEESVARLSVVGDFNWPGPPLEQITELVFPPPASVGRKDINSILSNRRARKVLADMSKLPVNEGSTHLRNELRAAVELYWPLYESKVRETLDSKRELTIPDAGLHWALQKKSDSGNSLEGLRLKILALVWFAGELELHECAEAVREVAELAIRQKNELYQIQDLHDFYKLDLLENGSVYNRQILATGIVGTKGRNIARDVGFDWEEQTLGAHQSLLTEYDLPVHSGMMQADMSHGTIKLRIVSPLDDEQFNVVMQKLGVSEGVNAQPESAVK